MLFDVRQARADRAVLLGGGGVRIERCHQRGMQCRRDLPDLWFDCGRDRCVRGIEVRNGSAV